MLTPYSLLTKACASDPARPRLTWYDDATDERVELSGTTLRNWVDKTVNFMIDELLVESGVSISLDLPRHWLTAVWWLASETVGARVVIGGALPDSSSSPSEHVDVAVFGPEQMATPPRATDRVAVALAPMARGFAEPLPDGVYDFENVVRTHGDHYAGPDLGDPETAAAALTSRDHWQLSPTDRLLAGGLGISADDLVRELLAPLAADASAVWVRNLNPSRTVQRASDEHISVTTLSATEFHSSDRVADSADDSLAATRLGDASRAPIRYLT